MPETIIKDIFDIDCFVGKELSCRFNRREESIELKSMTIKGATEPEISISPGASFPTPFKRAQFEFKDDMTCKITEDNVAQCERLVE